MTKLLSLFVLIASSSMALAAVLQFGVIYSSDYKVGSPLPSGEGYTTQTYVVVNLGTWSFDLADLEFTSSLMSTTTPVVPMTLVRNPIPPNTILNPGEAYGYINAGYNEPLSLAYIQSVFPDAKSLLINGTNGLQASFANPPDSGVTFRDSQTHVNYMGSQQESDEPRANARFVPGSGSDKMTGLEQGLDEDPGMARLSGLPI